MVDDAINILQQTLKITQLMMKNVFENEEFFLVESQPSHLSKNIH